MSAKYFRITLTFPSGGVLVGGQSGILDGIHAAHARDRDGRPVIPATAIRGALRETLEALLRGAGEAACSGGDGVAPAPLMGPIQGSPPPSVGEQLASASATSTEVTRRLGEPNLIPQPQSTSAAPPPPTPRRTRKVLCQLEGGSRCRACRLFGTRRETLPEGARHFSALILSDAVCQSNPDWTLRPGVAISRSLRSAEDHHIYLQHIPHQLDLRFVAEGRLLDPDCASDFRAAVASTHHLGAGRSRGMARVSMALQWLDPPAPTSHQLPPGDEVVIRMKFTSSAALGTPVRDSNLYGTRLEVPGAALRGAIGFALAEALEDPELPAFQDLVRPEGAHFGFLYPVEDSEPLDNGSSAPLPLTAVACKQHRRAHGLFDTLLQRLLVTFLANLEMVPRVSDQQLRVCQHRIQRTGDGGVLASAGERSSPCGYPLHGLSGWRRHPSSPSTHTVTRMEMDRQFGSARDESLFSRRQLEAGNVFEGAIRNIPIQSRDCLAQALALPLTLGRGRAYGWGQVAIELRPAPEKAAVEARGADFDMALRALLVRLELPVDPVGRLIPVTLLSPLIPRMSESGQPDDDGERALLEALGGGQCRLKVRRFGLEGGWDQRDKGAWSRMATVAGSVFVLELSEKRHWRDVLSTLETLERRGVGDHCHQGYGQVVCFDPFILKQPIEKAGNEGRGKNNFKGRR